MTTFDKPVAVTGADGFIGSHVVEAFVKAGAQVRALNCYNSFGTAGWLDELPKETLQNVEIQSGDIRDPFFVDQFVDGCGTVAHLAALIAIPFSYVAPQTYIEVNVQGTLNVLQACKSRNADRLLHTSTSEIYGTALFTPITEEHPIQTQSPYAASKSGADHLVESFVRSYGMPAAIIRPFNTFGPRQSERAVIPTIIRQALEHEGGTIRLGDLTPVRDFNFVEDTARAYVVAAQSDRIEFGKVYNVGTGQAQTIGQTADLIQKICGTDKAIETDASRARPKDSEVFELLADSTRFNSLTGWKPEHSFQAGLEKTVDWWRTRLAAGTVVGSKENLVL